MDESFGELGVFLDAFRAWMTSFELEIGKEPAAFPAFREGFEARLREGEALCEDLDRKLVRKAQRASWAHPGHELFLQAPVNWRAFHKPRGYAGDGELLDMFHRAGYEGETPLGRLIHRVSMLQPAAQAVRNRVELVREGMEEAMYRMGVKSRFLSMGCGTSPELRRFCLDHPYYETADWRWVGLDVDPVTVATAQGRHLDPRLSFATVNPLDLAKDASTWAWGEFDFIYAVGLFDYFPIGIGQPLTRAMFDHLRPGGRMWVGNFHPRNPTRWYMEYVASWHLLHRTEDQLMAFTGGLPEGAYTVSVFGEPAGAQVFLEIVKG